MNLNPSGWWLTCALLDGAVGAGILVYGFRQREARSLVCGLLLNALPMLLGGTLALVAGSVAVLGAYIAAFKYL